MQFNIYDVLASLIPGTFLSSVILGAMGLILNNSESFTLPGELSDFSGIMTSIFLVLSFVIGYLIHAVGSWIEPILWKAWGGRPSKILLTNSLKRIRLVNHNQTLNLLKEKAKSRGYNFDEKENLKNEDYRVLFQIAKYSVYSSLEHDKSGRLDEFNNSYIFSRNILVAAILSIIVLSIVSIKGIFHIGYLLYSIPILWIFWRRCQDRAVYYSREIFSKIKSE